MHIEKTKVFSLLSNAVRLRCVYLLAKHDEICVCELVEALNISQPTASKALASLKSSGLVSDRRDANWIYYQLKPELPEWLQTVLSAVVEDLTSNKTYIADEKRFTRLVARPRELACP
jgi:ArsR family transcriptional regulator